MKKSNSQKVTRRDFVKTTAAATAFTIVPRHVLGKSDQPAPSDKLNIASVGAGGMAATNLGNMAAENIVALCDVDWANAAGSFEKFPNANRYKDFRVMLEKERDNIDAVLVAAPDHIHAVATLAAMELGKHVYTQKPLTKTIAEARALQEASKKYKVVTQMGNQHHSGEEIRLVIEWIRDGAIGDVHTVHAWSDRPVWPQAIYDRPQAMPVPETLDWDLWLGPAPFREYNKAYAPFNWRGWVDFGTGALGDMGCHIIDLAHTALKLRYPISASASYTMDMNPENIWEKRKISETFPQSSIVSFNFPARKDMPPVSLHWYDGGLQPARPVEMDARMRMPTNGLLFEGTKGKLISGDGMTRLIPESFMREYEIPEQTIPRMEITHEENWIQCCKEFKTANSHFNYAAPLTESVLLGNIALHFPQELLEYDWKKMEILNNAEATALIKPNYREGWK